MADFVLKTQPTPYLSMFAPLKLMSAFIINPNDLLLEGLIG